jgi:hypothetical protein
MTFKQLSVDKNYLHQSSTKLVEGECGGCGTKEDVVDFTCKDCAKGYPEPSHQEMLDAQEYARLWL